MEVCGVVNTAVSVTVICHSPSPGIRRSSNSRPPVDAQDSPTHLQGHYEHCRVRARAWRACAPKLANSPVKHGEAPRCGCPERAAQLRCGRPISAACTQPAPQQRVLLVLSVWVLSASPPFRIHRATDAAAYQPWSAKSWHEWQQHRAVSSA